MLVKATLMTIGDIAVKARADTNSDSTSYTDALLLINLNIWYQKVVSMILESQDESDFDDANITATYPIATRPLVANQRDYAFGTASWTLKGKEGGSDTSSQALLPLKVKRVDITYDGNNYYKAEPFDDGEFPFGMGNDTNVDANFIKEAPRYDIKFNSILVYPMAAASDVSAGAKLRVEQERNVTPFTSSDLSTGTLVPGFDAPFHPMLSDGAALEYAVSRQLPQLSELQSRLTDWEARLRQAYGKKDLDRTLRFDVRFDDNYGR